MRTILGVGLVALATGMMACSTFKGDDATSKEPDADPDAGNVEGDAATGGSVTDDSIRLDVAATEVRIVQGQSVKIDVGLERKSGGTGIVTISVTGLRDGVTAAPLSLEGDEGTLDIHASTGAAQGGIDAVVHATLEGSAREVTKPLKLFVRGPAGSLDTTFADGGYYRDKETGILSGSLVIGPEDVIYASFGNNVRRLSSNGVLDTTYGDNGLATVSPKLNLLYQSAGLTADGGLLFAGSFRTDTPQHGFGKLLPSGKPDASFGDGTWGTGSCGVPTNAGGAAVASFVPLPNGNILFTAAPHAGPPSGNTLPLNMLDHDGKSDTTFGDGGHKDFSFYRLGPNNSYVWLTGPSGGVQKRKDGSLLVSGTTSETAESGKVSYLSLCNVDEAHAELNAWFGQFGCIAIQTSGLDTPYFAGMAELPDGHLFLVFSDWQTKRSILRLQANGTIDAAYGTAGWSAPIPVQAGWTPDTWLLLSDGFLFTESKRSEDSLTSKSAFVRLTKTGGIDTTYGQGGRVELDDHLVEGVSFYQMANFALQSDERIIVRGSNSPIKDTHGYEILSGPMFVARYWN